MEKQPEGQILILQGFQWRTHRVTSPYTALLLLQDIPSHKSLHCTALTGGPLLIILTVGSLSQKTGFGSLSSVYPTEEKLKLLDTFPSEQ